MPARLGVLDHPEPFRLGEILEPLGVVVNPPGQGRIAHDILRVRVPLCHHVLVDQLAEHLGVVRNHAGALQVGLPVERKLLSDGVEERRVGRLQQALIADVVHAEVREDASLHATGVQNMHVAPCAGQAAANRGSIIPEVGHEQAVLLPHLGDAFATADALLGGGNKLEDRVLAHWNEHEVPGEQDAEVEHGLDKPVVREHVQVVAGVGDADPEKHTIGAEQLHTPQCLSVDARAAPSIGFRFESFQTQGRRNVAQAGQFPHQRLVEQGSVGEDQEVHVAVLPE